MKEDKMKVFVPPAVKPFHCETQNCCFKAMTKDTSALGDLSSGKARNPPMGRGLKACETEDHTSDGSAHLKIK